MTITRDAVIRIIAEESGLDEAKLAPGTKLQELDISSIDLVSAIFTIEDKLAVTIAPEDIAPDATIDQLVDMVMARAPA